MANVGRFTADGAGNFAPNDGVAMGAYLERYIYDTVGNFQKVQHRSSDPVHQGWTRAYVYAEVSNLENGRDGTLYKTSNRLSNITPNPNSANPLPEPYDHDSHGNMVRMPHLGSGSRKRPTCCGTITITFGKLT